MSNKKFKNSEKNVSALALKKASFNRYMRKYWQYYLLLLVPVIYYIVIRYVPMAGNIIAFRRYRAGHSIFGDEWSGFKYFKQFIADTSFWRAFRNTLALNTQTESETVSSLISILQEELARKDAQIENLQKLLDQEQQLHMHTKQQLQLLEQKEDIIEEPEPTKKKWWQFFS